MTKRLSPDYIGVASLDEYKPFIEALSKYQGFADVKNVGAAIHAMTKLSLQLLDDVGYTRDKKWTQLSSIFGSSAVPIETSETIKAAVDKMIDEGLITKKNKLDFVKILAEKYLGEGLWHTKERRACAMTG